MTHSCKCCRERLAIIRGCCRRCYNQFARLVAAGETTWQDLEAQGKVTPKKEGPWEKGYMKQEEL
jgi:hypothetical protein